MSIISKVLEERKMKGKDPCWKGYQMVGMKDKDGSKVPNCVPEEVELDEAQQITHSKVEKLMGDTKSRGEAIEKVKKTFKCSHEDACKHVDSVIGKSMKEEKEEQDTADYKIGKDGRKVRAHKVVFNKGEEEMKEELKGNQHKIDLNKNGKVDGEDLANLRKKKSFKDFKEECDIMSSRVEEDFDEISDDILEELEQIEEISKQTLGSYIKKASKERGWAGMEAPNNTEHGRAAKETMKKRQRGLEKAVDRLTKEEAEQIDELSKSTLASYVKKASRSVGAKRSIATSFEKDADYMSGDKKDAFNKASADFNSDARKRLANVGKAADRLAKEETEQIDELSKSTLASYAKKASVNALSSGVSAGGTMANGDYKKGGERLDKGIKRTAGISKAVDRLAKEEFDLDEEIKPYVSGGHADGWSILDHSGKEVKNFHWKDYKDHPVKDKRKAARDDAMAYFKKHYNKLRKPTNECIEEHLLDLCEGMIDRDDFDDRVAAYKKAGHKVLDAKHSDTKAHISFVDPEGTHRTVKYTPTGKTMQNHGAYEGGKNDDQGNKVNKTEVKTVKRGRGRPRKDKFAESVDILLSLTEEEFEEILRDSTLDEIVESLCNLSEEELKELKG